MKSALWGNTCDGVDKVSQPTERISEQSVDAIDKDVCGNFYMGGTFIVIGYAHVHVVLKKAEHNRER